MNAIMNASVPLDHHDPVVDLWRVNNYPMHVEYSDGTWSIWVRNEVAQMKWMAAAPLVEGCAVRDMRFTPPFLADDHYPDAWRQTVRAKFLSLVAIHYLDRPGETETTLTLMTTLDSFTFQGADYHVEYHCGERIVVSSQGSAVACMRLGAGAQLGPAAPGDQAQVDAVWLDAIRAQVITVLDASGRDGRGPWAPGAEAR